MKPDMSPMYIVHHLHTLLRLPWDTWSAPSRPICTNLDQVTLHEKEYYALADMKRGEVLTNTGCLLPCHFREFKSVGTPVTIQPGVFGFQLSYAKSEYAEEREVFLYDLTSFVSEFGGSLGLFLGFLFFSCWDTLHLFFTTFYCKAGKVAENKRNVFI